MKLQEVLKVLREHEAELRSQGVKTMSIFGSVARGEERPDSDVDILVEFNRRVGLFTFIGLKLYLEGLLGCPVDLVTPGGIRSWMKDEILREAVRAA